MRWTRPGRRRALLAAAGLLSACAGRPAAAPRENRVAHGADLVQRDSRLDRRQARRGAGRLQALLPQARATTADSKIVTDGGEKTITAAEWKHDLRSRRRASGQRRTRGARRFFEENFRPLIVQAPGKFTGYFEPEMRGSRAPSRLFTVPVYRRPPDLGRRALLHPRRDRAGRAERQGAGDRLGAGSGRTVRGAGAGQRSHPSRRGRHAVDRLRRLEQPALHRDRRRARRHGRDAKDEVHLAGDPRLAEAPSAAGPRGDAQERALHLLQGYPHVGRRRLAGRTRSPPSAASPSTPSSRPTARRSGSTPSGRWPASAGSLEIYRRLLIAQDCGTAIKGPARGDVFFGSGSQAADWAGRMVGGGQAIVLVPNRG